MDAADVVGFTAAEWFALDASEETEIAHIRSRVDVSGPASVSSIRVIV